MIYNLKESKDVCKKAIERYGESAQIYLAMMEARYLARAIQRYLDCRREGAEEDKLEEALVLLRSKRAKVKFMLTQLAAIERQNARNWTRWRRASNSQTSAILMGKEG